MWNRRPTQKLLYAKGASVAETSIAGRLLFECYPGIAVDRAKVGARAAWGQVYRARDPKLQRDVALKLLPPDTAADPERRQRFEREARAVAALNHPNTSSSTR